MKVLITGAFGNIGASTVAELLKHTHVVRCFDLKTKANQKTARKFAGQIEVVWGDIRQFDQVKEAVQGQEVVIHLAAIIPPLSEAQSDLAQAVNVGGTKNVIAALQAMPVPAKLIQASSLALFGRTQDKPPPRTVSDSIYPTDHYTRHKAECEKMVQESGLDWAILRFAAVLPLAVLGQLDPLMFEVPLTDRIEFVHTYDVGLALTNAIQSEEIWGKILLIGGGPNCQLHQRDIMEKSLEAIGIGMLPEAAFGTTPYHTDWLDTTESQQLLKYQRYTFDDYIRDITKVVGYRRYCIKVLRPLIRWILLKQSPYFHPNQK